MHCERCFTVFACQGSIQPAWGSRRKLIAVHAEPSEAFHALGCTFARQEYFGSKILEASFYSSLVLRGL